MRLVISRDQICGHEGSMRCERCFPNVFEMKKEGVCVIQQEDDGLDLVTFVVEHDGQQDTYLLTQAQMAPLLGESWQTVLAGIEPFRVVASPSSDPR